jgi:hypothetical protein
MGVKLCLKKERRLMMFENTVMRIILNQREETGIKRRWLKRLILRYSPPHITVSGLSNLVGWVGGTSGR